MTNYYQSTDEIVRSMSSNPYVAAAINLNNARSRRDFRFKIGDKVQWTRLRETNKTNEEIVKKFYQMKGKTFTITEIETDGYGYVLDDLEYYWYDDELSFAKITNWKAEFE